MRASRGCSRRANERQGALDVQSMPRCRAQSLRVPSLQQRDGFRQAFTATGHSREAPAELQTRTGSNCNRSSTPESRSCEVCTKRSRWSPCERRQRLHQNLNDLVKVPTSSRAVTTEIHLTLIFNVEMRTSHRPLRCREGHFPEVHCRLAPRPCISSLV